MVLPEKWDFITVRSVKSIPMQSRAEGTLRPVAVRVSRSFPTGLLKPINAVISKCFIVSINALALRSGLVFRSACSDEISIIFFIPYCSRISLLYSAESSIINAQTSWLSLLHAAVMIPKLLFLISLSLVSINTPIKDMLFLLIIVFKCKKNS